MIVSFVVWVVVRGRARDHLQRRGHETGDDGTADAP
jgi:hypothetical protein